jgi:hypothetical protein
MLPWLPVVAGLPDHEIRAFLDFARNIHPDVDTSREHAEALYNTYRQWERPDLPPITKS